MILNKIAGYDFRFKKSPIANWPYIFHDDGWEDKDVRRQHIYRRNMSSDRMCSRREEGMTVTTGAETR